MSNAEKGLRIGWASASITPDKPVQLQGQFYERVSECVRDPLMATALAFEAEDGSEQAVIVSCDLTSIHDDVFARIQKLAGERAAGLDGRKVLLSVTHTHTAPVLKEGFYPDPRPDMMRPPEYVELLVDQVVAAIVQAWENRAVGGVSWVLSHAAIGFNRRVVYDDGTSLMYGDTNSPHFVGLEGTHDHAIEMLFCWDVDGDLTGIVINPACPSQVVEHKRFISADYWSAVRDRIWEKYGKDIFVLGLCSAAGDQSPRDLVRRGRGEPDMFDEAGLEEKGRRIARAVEYVMDKAKRDIRTSVVFNHVVEDLALPAKKVTDAQAQEAREELAALRPAGSGPDDGGAEPQSRTQARSGQAGGKPDTDRILALRWQRVLDVYEGQADEPVFPMQLHVLRLGDIALATNPFELFLDYGLRIKARSKAEQTFLAQLACGRGGYLPTRKSVAGGGYGASVTDGLVGPDGGDALVERSVELINELFWS